MFKNRIPGLEVFFLFLEMFSLSLSDRLVFLHTHFRHGARAPLGIDQNFNDKLGEHWTNPGELTGVGQRMHYLLGLRNRLRYIKEEQFLSEKFDPHQILIYSSNLNRTMISVSSQLQGLYPQKDANGETLTEAQQKIAYPQVDIDNEYINEAIEELGDNALPYAMTLAPVRMLNDLDKKIFVYNIGECQVKRNEIFKKNDETIPEWIDYVDDLNEKYGELFNKFFGTSGKFYSATELHDICDSFISGYWDDREMKDFKDKTGIIFEEFKNDCLDYFKKLFIYRFYGDSERALAYVDSSKLISKIIYYMKRRLDADMSSIDEDANFKDYSYPRMLMVSGHDSSIVANLLVYIKALGLNETDIYRLPK